MRTPRREIIVDGDIVHVIWRCHNRSSLLIQNRVKQKIIELYFRYKDKYGITIIEFQTLDNHCHWVLKIRSVEELGRFARVVHSQIAMFVNKLLKRDSQVIRERYKSPPVREERYCERLIGYVLMNKIKADKKTRPENDPYCSAYHRLNNTKIGKLLGSYSDLGLCPEGEDKKYLRRIIKYCLSQLTENSSFFDPKCFVGQFAVGSCSIVERVSKEVLDRFKKQREFSVDHCV